MWEGYPEVKMNEFQSNARSTWGGDGSPYPQELCCALGVAGEAGEVADLVKKEYFHDHPRNPLKVLEELGDTLFYIAMTAYYYGFTLEEVALENNRKLAARYPNGFESERSINRNER